MNLIAFINRVSRDLVVCTYRSILLLIFEIHFLFESDLAAIAKALVE